MRTSWDTQQQHVQAQWNEINAENCDLAHRSDATGAGRQQAEETAAQLAATRTEPQDEVATWVWQAQAALTWQENKARMRMQQAEARTLDLEASARWREAAGEQHLRRAEAEITEEAVRLTSRITPRPTDEAAEPAVSAGTSARTEPLELPGWTHNIKGMRGTAPAPPAQATEGPSAGLIPNMAPNRTS